MRSIARRTGPFTTGSAATSVATIYDHVFGWIAPYGYFSLPVILGTVGGVGMIIGAMGLTWIKIVTDPEPVSRKVVGGEYAMLGLLFFVSLTGLVLLAARETSAMGVLLAVHLGFVLALFLLLPYGKMAHGAFRTAALVKAAIGEVVADQAASRLQRRARIGIAERQEVVLHQPPHMR